MTAADKFTGDITAPACNFAVVTTSDTADLDYITRGLYVGVAGDITAEDMNGNPVLFKSVPVGILPIRTKRVLNTGTAATNIVALW